MNANTGHIVATLQSWQCIAANALQSRAPGLAATLQRGHLGKNESGARAEMQKDGKPGDLPS
jgi:hypothetical protein